MCNSKIIQWHILYYIIVVHVFYLMRTKIIIRKNKSLSHCCCVQKNNENLIQIPFGSKRAILNEIKICIASSIHPGCSYQISIFIPFLNNLGSLLQSTRHQSLWSSFLWPSAFILWTLLSVQITHQVRNFRHVDNFLLFVFIQGQQQTLFKTVYVEAVLMLADLVLVFAEHFQVSKMYFKV